MLSRTRRSGEYSSSIQKNSSRIILSMKARYVGACPCGALIDVGDTIKYDTLGHKAYCFDCGRRRAELKESVLMQNAETDEKNMLYACQPLIDRFRELKATQDWENLSARQEIGEILAKFRTEYVTNPNVRQLVSEFINCPDRLTCELDLIVISAKYEGLCVHCKNTIQPGDMCLYDRDSKRTHCLNCDCL